MRNKDELICDFAEYYHIYDVEGLPINTLAVLSCGLPEHSRTMLKVNGMKVPPNTLLLAAAVDRLNTLVWFQTEDGHKGRNRPQSIVETLLSRKSEGKDWLTFLDGAEFEKRRQMILKEGR